MATKIPARNVSVDLTGYIKAGAPGSHMYQDNTLQDAFDLLVKRIERLESAMIDYDLLVAPLENDISD